MSKIFEAAGIVIHVWPNDHRPIHCHVFFDGYEMRVFLPDYKVQIVSKKTPNVALIKKVIDIVKDNRGPIGREWRRFHGN